MLLQLGISDGDYAILEVINGLIQFRYNLGNGERLLIIQNRRVDDDTLHNVSLTRRAYSAELVLDTIYIVTESVPIATAYPYNDILLDIASDMVYLGASVSRSRATGYFVGCIQGMTLNGHDLPANGETEIYQAMPSNGRLVEPCSNREKNADPTSFFDIFDTFYIMCGVVLVGLFVISCASITCCKCLHYCYIRKRRKLEIRNRSNSSANSFRFSSGNRQYSLAQSPSGFRYSNSFEPVEVSPQLSLHQCRSSTPSLEPATFTQQPSSLEIVPTEQRMPSPVHPVCYLDPMTGMPIHHQRAQSNSSESITTATTEPLSNSEMKQYILSKKAFADTLTNEMSYDEVHVFSEDSYEPRGSIGSLHDIINIPGDKDEPRARLVKMEISSITFNNQKRTVCIEKPLLEKKTTDSSPMSVLSKKKKRKPPVPPPNGAAPRIHRLKSALKPSNLQDTENLLSYNDDTDGKLAQELRSLSKKPSKLTGETASASPLSIHETLMV